MILYLLATHTYIIPYCNLHNLATLNIVYDNISYKKIQIIYASPINIFARYISYKKIRTINKFARYISSKMIPRRMRFDDYCRGMAHSREFQ